MARGGAAAPGGRICRHRPARGQTGVKCFLVAIAEKTELLVDRAALHPAAPHRLRAERFMTDNETTDLIELRRLASRLFVLALWLHVPLVLALSAAGGAGAHFAGHAV